MDIVYIITTLYNFIIIHPSQDKKSIYDRKDSDNKKSKDVNGNQNKDKINTLLSDKLLINQKCDIIV